VGRTVALPYDPDFQPKFLPPDQWRTKQATIRQQFATTLPTIIDRFKSSTAQQPPKPAPAAKP
jgi:hypothetical protein